MESGKKLNKALSEIYSDLEKLQNAREQVEIVTESCDELTKSTSTLLDELNTFSIQFGKENTNNVLKLTKSLGNFDDKINVISNKGEKTISEYIKSFKNKIVNVNDEFSKQILENEKNITAINSINNNKINDVIKQFEKATKELKVNVEQEIYNLKSIALVKIENQEKEISKTIKHILETNSKTENLITIIANHDIPNKLESINIKIEYLSNENKSHKKLLFVIIGLLSIGIISFLVNMMII